MALLSRSRAPTSDELRAIPWLTVLMPDERERALADLRVVEVGAGEHVCRVGRQPAFWFGVIDGLLKMSNDTAQGIPMTFTGIPPGGWFGEGTLLKHEPYRYNIQSLRRSLIAGITVQTFDGLLARSIGFNRFVMLQLNERLGQFIGAREIDRLTQPDQRVARSLAALWRHLGRTHRSESPPVGDGSSREDASVSFDIYLQKFDSQHFHILIVLYHLIQICFYILFHSAPHHQNLPF